MNNIKSSREQARNNLRAFLWDAGYMMDDVIVLEPNIGDCEGRYRFSVQHRDRVCVIDMPGFPLDRVRYINSIRGLNIRHFPRIYIDGDSWLWKFAVNAINWNLRGTEGSPIVLDTIKGIVLRQDEVKQLHETGFVTIWRDVRPQPVNIGDGWAFDKTTFHTRGLIEYLTAPHPDGWTCPYIGPKEIRYVRETFVLWDYLTDEYEGDLHRGKLPVPDKYTLHSWKKRVQYRASTSCDDESYQWRPSTTMPEWASRFHVVRNSITTDRRGDTWQVGIELHVIAAPPAAAITDGE